MKYFCCQNVSKQLHHLLRSGDVETWNKFPIKPFITLECQRFTSMQSFLPRPIFLDRNFLLASNTLMCFNYSSNRDAYTERRHSHPSAVKNKYQALRFRMLNTYDKAWCTFIIIYLKAKSTFSHAAHFSPE